MVDIFTVTNVLLLTTVSATITKKKIIIVGAKKNNNLQTNKQATRERNTEVVMLQGTVENTANFFLFFSSLLFLTTDQCDQFNSVIKIKEWKWRAPTGSVLLRPADFRWVCVFPAHRSLKSTFQFSSCEWLWKLLCSSGI